MFLYIREQRDLAEATRASIADIDVDDEFDDHDSDKASTNEGSSSSATHRSLTCGVEKCPSSATEWP